MVVSVIFYETVAGGQVVGAKISYDGKKYTCEGDEVYLDALPPESEGPRVIVSVMQNLPYLYSGDYLRAEYVDSTKGGEGSGHYGHTGLSGTWGGSTPTGTAIEATATFSEEDFIEAAESGDYESSGDMNLGGVAHAELVEYKNGSWGVWKPIEADDSWHSGYSEVAAYELSELLELGIVPATVYSDIDGHEGTSQLFLVNSTVGDRLDWETVLEVWSSHPKRERIALLDHLTGNGDRHEGNWMLDQDTGKLWAIDHGHCMWQEASSTPLGNVCTGNFIPDASQNKFSHTFSVGLMSHVRNIVGDSEWRRGSNYDAYLAGFSHLTRRAFKTEIDSAWDKMVGLVRGGGTVTWIDPEW